MPIYKGRWTARVDQPFEVEAESEEEARRLVEEDEMEPRNVVELLDFEIEELQEASGRTLR